MAESCFVISEPLFSHTHQEYAKLATQAFDLDHHQYPWVCVSWVGHSHMLCELPMGSNGLTASLPPEQ